LGAFGEKLRKQREQRGIALDAISNTTKISTRMLRALEEEHFDQLPGGVFNKGFVRAYARQVGLDEEETVTDYLAALRESQLQSQTILPDFRAPGGKHIQNATPPPRSSDQSADAETDGDDGNHNGSHSSSAAERRKLNRRNQLRRNQDRERKEAVAGARRSPLAGDQDLRQEDSRNQDQQSKDQRNQALPGFIASGPSGESAEAPSARSPLFSRIILAAALLLATAGLALWNSHRHRQSAAKTEVSSNASSVAQSSATQIPSASPQITPGPSTPPVGKSSAAAPATKASLTSSVPKAAATTPPPNPSAVNPSSANPSPANSPPATSLVAKSATHPAAPKEPATFTVSIRADETTWISITADGKPVAHETLIAPAHTSVRAVREIVVRAGNAAGVSFLVNNKEIPASGNEGEVKTYVFDPNGLSSAPQAQLPANNR